MGKFLLPTQEERDLVPPNPTQMDPTQILDCFMMKEGDRHRMVIKISTVQEASFSNHR